MIRVNSTSNIGSVVYIQSNPRLQMELSECVFYNNTSVRGPTLYIDKHLDIQGLLYFIINIEDSVFDSNTANDKIVYVVYGIKGDITIKHSNFTNNFGTGISLVKGRLGLKEDTLFANNSATNGAAVSIDQTSTILVEYGTNVQFVNNSASSLGGAIFIELNLGCPQNSPIINTTYWSPPSKLMFINNSAGYGPNSIYFSVSKYCHIVTDSSYSNSIMHVPYQFNYSQIINGTLTHIPTDYDYTSLNVTQFPVVTSPHQLKLYGDGVLYFNKNTYFVGNKILGTPVIFQGIVLDYLISQLKYLNFNLSVSTALSSGLWFINSW